MKYSYGTNADQYLNKEGLEYLIEQLDLKYSGSGTVDLTNYYDKAEIDNLLSNIGGSGTIGNDGVGIQSVELVNYELIVTLTDDTVINLGNVRGEKGLQGLTGLDGAKGTDGVDGINGIDGKDGLDGADGINGRGITSVVKTDTVDLVDTYTITYSDMTTSNFTVTNGKDGEGGSSGGGSSTDTYSTDEIAIGTWIDGKTIYRKVIDLTEYNPTIYIEDHEMMYNFNHNISNIGTVIRTDLLYTDKDIYQEVNTNMKSTKISGSTASSLAISVSNMTKWGSSIQINNTKIFIKYGLNIGTTTGITNGILIVEYTKTV